MTIRTPEDIEKELEENGRLSQQFEVADDTTFESQDTFVRLLLAILLVSIISIVMLLMIL